MARQPSSQPVKQAILKKGYAYATDGWTNAAIVMS